MKVALIAVCCGAPPPPPSMVPDFWQMLALAVPVALAVLAFGVFAHAVYEHHSRGRSKSKPKRRTC